MNKALFLDLETTGFSRQWDEIIEIAAITYDLDTGTILSTFHEYIKPTRKISPKITDLTGITQDMVDGCRKIMEVLCDFTQWVYDEQPTTIIGHNCKTFDLQFIAEKCKQCDLSWDTNGLNIVDTLALARQLNKNGAIHTENCKQPTLAAYFGIEYEAHSAIEDTKALIKIYNKMVNSEEDVGF